MPRTVPGSPTGTRGGGCLRAAGRSAAALARCGACPPVPLPSVARTQHGPRYCQLSLAGGVGRGQGRPLAENRPTVDPLWKPGVSSKGRPLTDHPNRGTCHWPERERKREVHLPRCGGMARIHGVALAMSSAGVPHKCSLGRGSEGRRLTWELIPRSTRRGKGVTWGRRQQQARP